MPISFSSRRVDHLDLRHGTFRIGHRTLETPHFFPVMNIMTGPPTPPTPTLANGGLWKWLKRLALMPNVNVEGANRQPKINGILTQALHFLDYHITPRMLKRWLPEGKRDQLVRLIERDIATMTGATSAKSRLPFIFLDSGGYKLLSAQQIDLRAYGWRTTPRSILDLQLRMGGDFLATLDYPVHPLLSQADANTRFDASMKNAMDALRLVHKQGLDDKFVFLAVHGRNRRETHDYTRALLRRVAASPARRVPFGLALGSLVPLNNSPRQLISSVSGSMHAFREGEKTFDTSTIPVHAFGVNSSVAPYLTLLGVDTYDGSSYVRGAQNLTYYTPNGFSPRKLRELEKLECSCPGCTLMSRGTLTHDGRKLAGLEAVKFICSRTTQGHTTYFDWHDGYAEHQRIPAKTNVEREHPDELGFGVPRSYFYALLALHNLNSNHHQAQRVLDATTDDAVYRTLIEDAVSSPKTLQIVQALASIYPNTRSELRAWGLERLARPLTPSKAIRAKAVGSQRLSSAPRARVWIDPALGPEDFDILSTSYRIPDGRTVLILPCSKTKPYSASSTHRLIERTLEPIGAEFEKISLSGNYGPVPQSFEDVHNVLAYDYLLHESNTERILLVAGRLRALIERDLDRVPAVIAYVTAKPYRRAVEIAFDGLANCTILPDPLKAHTATQFRAPENLSRLVEIMHAADTNAATRKRAGPSAPLPPTRTRKTRSS